MAITNVVGRDVTRVTVTTTDETRINFDPPVVNIDMFNFGAGTAFIQCDGTASAADQYTEKLMPNIVSEVRAKHSISTVSIVATGSNAEVQVKVRK